MFVPVSRLPLLMQSISSFEKCVQTLSHTVAPYDANITNIEQMVDSLAARVTTLETNATSVSNGCSSARSWNILGHSDGSTATGSLGGQELNVEHAQIRTLLDRQKERILDDCHAEIRKHEFQADYDRSIQKWSETTSRRKNFIVLK